MSDQKHIGTGEGSALMRFGELLVRYSDWALGLGVLGLMVTLVTPIPPVALDVLLSLNITLSLLLLLVTMNARSSSELSTFPTVLLFATLFRLGLNVASTRLILTSGEAGSIIDAFGRYVIGDNLTVGLVVFLILIVIQFVVITKGSGRISEVAARFVLDAMPGKQMAIDADLNAGLIDSDEARSRRASIASEAEFYGAMDGASKFVRGDAIAGLIITALNLLGGIAIGTMNSLTFAEAGQRYSMLTVGDGLVSQIPALFVSTAAAVLVTKENSERSLGANLMAQVGGRPKATLIAAGMMFVIGLLPGMPAMPFFVLASILVLFWRSTRGAEGAESLFAPAKDPALEEPPAEEGESDSVTDLLRVDRLALEIGYRLIPLVQDEKGQGVLDHVAQLRRRFAVNDGVVIPPVRIKDNIQLEPNAYRVLVGGHEVARGSIEPNQFMAMDGGSASGAVRGAETVDPAFGLPAWWIQKGERDEAELKGFTVIDPTSVLVTHLSEVIRAQMPDILNRDDVKELIENVKQVSPALVEEVVPDKVGYGEIQQVLRNLLKEDVPVRNMPAILEAIADNAGRSRDPETLTELVRQRLGRVLVERHTDPRGTLWAVTLDPGVETRLAAAVGSQTEPDAQPVNPAWLQELVGRIADSLSTAARGGKEVVLLVRSNVRRFVGELVRSTLPKTTVLSYNEVVPAKTVETTGIVSMED
jgi:flagellar biosynthesis protein FlhA